MIPVYYDLHIHTALSPCADDDMTPNDIVGMALFNGLDIIAITDHNTLANAKSVITAAKAAKARFNKELIVLPGIEVSTAEEVHVLCLFKSIEASSDFEAELALNYSKQINRTDIFGDQILYDASDNITGKMERMLIAPTVISFDDLYFMTHKHDGAFVPAHVDRDSFSVISNLGFLPPDLDIKTVEITLRGAEQGYGKRNAEMFPKCKMISSSDAHQLGAISERKHLLLLPERSAEATIDFLH